MTVANREHLNVFQNVSTELFIGAADTTKNDVILGKAGYTIYVRRIFVAITTSAAQAWTFQDDNGTPKVIAVLPASASVGPHEFDFGEDGVPLTEAKNLDISLAAGAAGRVVIEAYRKPTGVLTPSMV